MKYSESGLSKWTDNLIENPDGRNKFTSVEINFQQDQKVTTRQTYGILDWLGDIGGLIDFLFLIFSMILGPYTSFMQKSLLLSKIFSFQASNPITTVYLPDSTDCSHL